MSDHRAFLRKLPSVDRILNTQEISALLGTCPHAILRDAAQQVIGDLRQQLLDGVLPKPDIRLETVAARAAAKALILNSPSLRRVINVTGTVLHTNLGRAPLCDSAIHSIREVASGYSNLEYDLTSGKRGIRHSHVEELICKLTGAEAATTVNNNAGAVLLALTALAGGRSALVSRGEMIEIGGAFRIPEVMAAGGVKLVEVGTTNKTRLEDYRNAIDQDTALIMKVHTSNYRILGFTETVPGEQLAGLAKECNLPLLEDLGSGLLVDLTSYGMPEEPTVGEALKKGIDIVTFSGDKLLGGPQAGIIAGRKEIVEILQQHPMARALRIDKLTLAALESTLHLYMDPVRALSEIPALRMLTTSADLLYQRCQAIMPLLEESTAELAELEIVSTTSTIGGGAMPLTELQGWSIALRPKNISINHLTQSMRNASIPVIGRVQDNRLLIDLRTLKDNEIPTLLSVIHQSLKKDLSNE